MRHGDGHFFDLGCVMNRIGMAGILLGILLLGNWMTVGVTGSIHEYKNAAFTPQEDSFFFLGGNEGLYASRVLNDSPKASSDDANNPLDGKSFIRFDSISFRRTKDVANKQNYMQTSTGVVEAIIVEVKDRDKIGGSYLNSEAICCTPPLSKDGSCKLGEVIIRQDPDNPGWPKRLQASFA